MEETLIVDKVYPKGENYDMLLNFQNGIPNENLDVPGVMLQNANGVKTIATEVSGIVYDGIEESESLGHTFLLARDRRTGKVRILEVGCVDLKPVFKTNLDASQNLDTSRLELSRKFGSKKQKQQMEHRAKLNVNIQTVTQQMEKVTENLTAEKLDLTDYKKADGDDFYLPPIDRSATKVEDVYPLNKLLTEDDYDMIYSELENKGYVSNLYPWIKSIVEEKKLSPRLTVLAVYADAILKFSTIPASNIKKKTFIAYEHSLALNRVILDNFTTTTNGKLSKPIRYKDKCTCFFIVLMLILNGYKFDMEPLCAALKMTPTTVTQKVRVVGATVNMGSKKTVQLKLPLASKPMRRKSAKF